MKIQNLVVRHIKGVRNVEIHDADPEGVEIAGTNGAGKSTILDCIRFAYGGPRAVDARLLRQGEEEGEVILESDDGWKVVRRLRDGKGPTAMITKDGEKRGQRDLDELFTSFTFDPLAFSRMKPTDQVTTLQSLAGAEHMEALAALDAQIKEASDERLMTGRELKRMGELEEVPEIERVDVGSLSDELQAAELHNRAQAKVASTLAEASDRRDRAADKCERIRQELAAAEADAERAGAAHAAAEVPQPLKDTTELHARLSEAGAVNRRADERDRHLTKLAEHGSLEKKNKTLDALVEELRNKRIELAKRAKLPVNGVTFSGSEVRVDGLPFEQLSSSEKITISARIGCRINSELRIMLIQDGSLLDPDSYRELLSVARAEGVQPWIETVGEGHGDAIVLEAGEVRDV